MMTGLAGAAMWLMMGLMLLGLAVGAITWTRRRLHGRHDDQPPPTDQTPSNSCSGATRPAEINRDEYLRRHRDRSER